MASTKQSYINSIVRAIKDSVCQKKALSRSYKSSRPEQKTYGTAVSITPLNPIEFELDWIQGLREQVEFANRDMKYHCISFKVQRRELVPNGDAK
jgi:hypothetical protein